MLGTFVSFAKCCELFNFGHKKTALKNQSGFQSIWYFGGCALSHISFDRKGV
jgi:hypothetical protein